MGAQGSIPVLWLVDQQAHVMKNTAKVSERVFRISALLGRLQNLFVVILWYTQKKQMCTQSGFWNAMRELQS